MVNLRFPARRSSDVKSSRNKLLQRQPSRVRSRNLAFDASFVISVGNPTSNVAINPLTPKDHYRGRTAPLASKRCILYIYSTNTGTEYFKHGIYGPFFSLSLQNAVCFIILTYLVPVLIKFYIQSVLKFERIIPAPKG